MKTLLCTLLLAIFSHAALADYGDTPYSPEVDARFRALEGKILPQSAKQTARVEFNPSLTAAQGQSAVAGGIHPLGVTLPAHAMITDSWGYIVTQLVATGSGNTPKVGFQCFQTNDILSPVKLHDLLPTQQFAGQQYGVSSVWANGVSTVGGVKFNGSSSLSGGSASAPCTVSAVVTGQDTTAGDLILFIEYSIAK
jgi:hypothetical protein